MTEHTPSEKPPSSRGGQDWTAFTSLLLAGVPALRSALVLQDRLQAEIESFALGWIARRRTATGHALSLTERLAARQGVKHGGTIADWMGDAALLAAEDLRESLAFTPRCIARMAHGGLVVGEDMLPRANGEAAPMLIGAGATEAAMPAQAG